jgi:predicted RNA-binding protein YlqC (UPF0109 family)
VRELARHLLNRLVTRPDRVSIQLDPEPDDLQRLMTVTVHPDDVKLVVGKRGRTVRAIRALMGSAASLSGVATKFTVDAETVDPKFDRRDERASEPAPQDVGRPNRPFPDETDF